MQDRCGAVQEKICPCRRTGSGLATEPRSQPEALEAIRVSVAVKGSLRRAAPALDRNGNTTERAVEERLS